MKNEMNFEEKREMLKNCITNYQMGFITVLELLNQMGEIPFTLYEQKHVASVVANAITIDAQRIKDELL